MSNVQDHKSSWYRYWTTGFTPWHKEQLNVWLWKYFHLLTGTEDGNQGLMLVPMCGKVRDLKPLYERGLKVVGVEFYEPAVKQFFQEQDLEFVFKSEGEFKEYATADGRLRILVGDFFDLTPEVLGEPVDVVWDRGGLGSIEKHLRKLYLKTVRRLLSPSFRFLLECYRFNDWYEDLPPRNFPRELIQDLFGDGCDVQLLDEEKDTPAQITSSCIYRQAYLIKPSV